MNGHENRHGWKSVVTEQIYTCFNGKGLFLKGEAAQLGVNDTAWVKKAGPLHICSYQLCRKRYRFAEGLNRCWWWGAADNICSCEEEEWWLPSMLLVSCYICKWKLAAGVSYISISGWIHAAVNVKVWNMTWNVSLFEKRPRPRLCRIVVILLSYIHIQLR